MTRTVAVANQKGGVGKTTTVVSLGAAFAEKGLQILLVDLDSQACLTFSVGADPDAVTGGAHEVLVGDLALDDVLLELTDRIDLVPATIDLAATETALATRRRRELVLRGALNEVAADYDVIMIDCSPSLGVLTLSALAAADEVIIPMQCEMLSHRGVGQLLDTVGDVQRSLNPDLLVRGLLPTMYDGRTSHSRAILDDVGERYDVPVLEPPIPRSVRFAEAPAIGDSVLDTSSESKGAQAYRDVAASLVGMW